MHKPPQFIIKLLTRASKKWRLLSQGRARYFELALSLTRGKKGIEIGGPTDLFFGWRNPSRWHWFFAPLPIYDHVGSLDNCNFSSATVWADHTQQYFFSSMKSPGKIIIAEGTDISTVASQSYDFVISSHNLEHFANPVGALLEWKRITRPGGALILVLPYYQQTFDHCRAPTTVEHMFEDYKRKMGEDDMTHLDEIIRLHDRTRDGFLKTGSMDELRDRCNNNLANRMMHHHVFDEVNSVKLLEEVGLDVLSVERMLPYHLIILARWKILP